MTRLGDVTDMLVGFAFKSSGFLGADADGPKLLRGDNVQQGYIRWGDKTKRWSPADSEDLERFQLAEGDVVLAMDRPIVGGGLKMAWIQASDLPCLLVQRVCRLRGKPEHTSTRFIRYVLASPEFSAHIDRVTTGANIPHISGRDIANYEFPLPSIENQQCIVAILSAYDDLLSNNERRINMLEEAARRLYREWFVHLRFPGHESTPLEDGRPKGWRIKSLGDVATLNYGKPLKATDRKQGTIPVYGSSGIIGWHSEWLVGAGSIIVGRKGNVGSLYFAHTPSFPIDTVFYTNPTETSYWLLLAMQSLNFLSSDAAVPSLNRSYALSLPLLVPTADVSQAFDQLVAPWLNQVHRLGQQSMAIARARDLLLPQLMSGRLDVSRISLPEEAPA